MLNQIKQRAIEAINDLLHLVPMMIVRILIIIGAATTIIFAVVTFLIMFPVAMIMKKKIDAATEDAKFHLKMAQLNQGRD